MKVERHVITKEDERQRTPRPKGNRISFTQLNTPCDLRLKFRRARVKVKSPRGVGLMYGNGMHGGIEAFLRGAARSPLDAVRAAMAVFDDEVRAADEVRWDEWPEVNKDGGISGSPSGNFGRIASREFAQFWMERQLPLYLATYATFKLLYSEKSIYVPLTRQPGWTADWSVESWLDFVIDCEPGYQIVDVKTTADPWDAKDYQKSMHQADLYMGAAASEWNAEPARPFQFHVMPRIKSALPVLNQARAWAFDGTPFESNEGIEHAIQVHEVKFVPERINTYIAGVIRPRISVIEAGAFAANPSGWHCSERWCDYWSHCAFGSGTNL